METIYALSELLLWRSTQEPKEDGAALHGKREQAYRGRLCGRQSRIRDICTCGIRDVSGNDGRA